jgi:hypothetical protein
MARETQDPELPPMSPVQSHTSSSWHWQASKRNLQASLSAAVRVLEANCDSDSDFNLGGYEPGTRTRIWLSRNLNLIPGS